MTPSAVHGAGVEPLGGSEDHHDDPEDQNALPRHLVERWIGQQIVPRAGEKDEDKAEKEDVGGARPAEEQEDRADHRQPDRERPDRDLD